MKKENQVSNHLIRPSKSIEKKKQLSTKNNQNEFITRIQTKLPKIIPTKEKNRN